MATIPIERYASSPARQQGRPVPVVAAGRADMAEP